MGSFNGGRLVEVSRLPWENPKVKGSTEEG